MDVSQLCRQALDDARVDRYLAVYTSLRLLVTGVLLLRTGLHSGAVARRLRRHRPYDLFLRQARQWLARVYS